MNTASQLSYILPLRGVTPEARASLDGYVGWLNSRVDLIIVDGSDAEAFKENGARWPASVHVSPDPECRALNGKVRSVLTGLRHASQENLIIADDDVRYDDESLQRITLLLRSADIVRPQNYFAPQPWHALWDTARTLLNRISGGDWPGTLAVRRSFLANGYNGDCLFENLELVRTVKAAGGREMVAQDVFVRRLPPSTRHFLSQRVRQAYDEWARPLRFIVQLALLPVVIVAAWRSPWALAGLAACAVALAEAGRRIHDGTRVFPAKASLMAPLWLLERMTCAWAALAIRLLAGGVPYHGTIISKPASSMSELRARQAQSPAKALP